jgi:uncharacterized Zn-finger protein
MNKVEVTQTSSSKPYYEVSRQQLPLSCPMPDMPLWDAHPRVYLPITETGKANCPYCGAEFNLID